MKESSSYIKYTDMRALIEHAAGRFPEKDFFMCSDEKFPSVKASELFDLCRKATPVLDRIGEYGNIAVLGPGSSAWLTAYFAVISAGRVIVPLHDGMQQQELEDC